MARYVGAAVATALTATVYATVSANQRDDGASAASALASGLAAASWVMAVISLIGVAMAVVVIRRIRSGQRGSMEDVLAAAASVVHTVPPAPRTSSSGSLQG
jgi:hypothetical protein